LVLADFDEMTAFTRAVGHVLRMERQHLNWSLAETGEMAGLSVSVLCRVELGVRPVDMRRLVGLCAVLGPSPLDVIARAQAEAYPLGGQRRFPNP
jgi:transcriptional regulator with XRE-family HTH domain